MRLIFMFLIAACLIPAGLSAQTEITPGEYITERGWGNLEIKKDKKGNLLFEIGVIGENYHTCELSGIIRDSKSVMEGDEGKPCIVNFSPTENGIAVSDNDGACRGYCGARASFIGLYLKPQKGCDTASITRARNELKKLYDKKNYEQARSKLEPVLNKCSGIMHWSELGRARNDLAITLYKLGDFDGCRNVLKPLEEDAKKTDEELRESYAPVDAETAIPIARATRTNLKLCSQTNKKAEPADKPDHVFKPALEQIKGKVKIPILLPTRLPTEIQTSKIKVVEGSVKDKGYSIILSYGDCGNACFAGSFAGTPAVNPWQKKKGQTKLPNGIMARFMPVSCGGSCSPANLWWEQDGVEYAIQLKLISTMSVEKQRKILIETAASVTEAKP